MIHMNINSTYPQKRKENSQNFNSENVSTKTQTQRDWSPLGDVLWHLGPSEIRWTGQKVILLKIHQKRPDIHEIEGNLRGFVSMLGTIYRILI